jgi:RNA polymerase sigma factor (sigma-70 family)
MAARKHNVLLTLAKMGNEDAKVSLIQEHAGMIVMHAVSWGEGLHYTEDLVQEGVIAFLDAVEHFKFDHGASFSTYAWEVIRRRMAQVRPGLADSPQRAKETWKTTFKIVNAHRDFLAETGRPPTIEEVSERSGVDTIAVWALLGLNYRHREAGESQVQIASFREYVDASKTIETEDICLQRVGHYIARISRRERVCLLQHYGALGEPYRPDSVLAKRLKVPKRRVITVRQNAIEKIRAAAREARETLGPSQFDTSVVKLLTENGGELDWYTIRKRNRHRAGLPESMKTLEYRGVVEKFHRGEVPYYRLVTTDE